MTSPAGSFPPPSLPVRRNGRVKWLLIGLALLVFVAAVGLMGAGHTIRAEMNRPGPSAKTQIIWVKRGANVPAIAQVLARQGAIRSERLFVITARLRRAGGNLQAGEFEIPPQASLNDIIDILSAGKPLLHFITLPEGRTSKQITRTIAANDVLLGDVTLSPDEGVMLPETYGFVRGETKDEMINRLRLAQRSLLDTLWPGRAAGLPLETREEAIILASIVEKETGARGERARVAAVFINRLRRGMRLESDVTTLYGIMGGEPLGRGLRRSELRGKTPYNTYVIPGLPPGPITNPGRAAIEAVLHPAETDDIFFVADGTGGHAFAETLRAHNENVRKWRRIERARKN